MLQLTCGGAPRSVRRVLALGCHADDIEIGAGATVLTLARGQPNVSFTWVVLSAADERAREARASAAAFVAGAAEAEVEVHEFRDGYFPYVGAEIKDVFESLKERVQPDVILTHARSDLHQDHRLVCELTWNTFRDHLILEYEIPKYDGDLSSPNVFVPVSEELAREKARLIIDHFPSQTSRAWFDEELFRAMMRIRGMEGRSESGYAEAFIGRKVSVSLA